MRISDWSSDVCSSDLPDVAAATLETDAAAARASAADSLPDPEAMIEFNNNTWPGSAWSNQDSNRTYKIEQRLDRKSVVSGKSVSVRVDLGGRRIIKKKRTNLQTLNVKTTTTKT